MLVGTCYNCSAPAMFTCTVCGRTVCINCYIKDSRLCVNCNKKLRPQEPGHEQEGPPGTYAEGEEGEEYIDDYDDY
jgi:hypothetical protein